MKISILDILIPIGAVLPMWLSYQNDNELLLNASPIVGLLLQPFWYYVSIRDKSVGFIITSVIFTFIYLNKIFM